MRVSPKGAGTVMTAGPPTPAYPGEAVTTHLAIT